MILFVAASPQDMSPLCLAEECAEIHREIKLSRFRDVFHLESRWAVSIDELMRLLTELDPEIIHISAHGSASAGLLLQDEQGRPQPVTPRALSMMIEATARRARLVVLNACYSLAQARRLIRHVDCVICMDGAIDDLAARTFATRLYGALASGRSVGNAIEQSLAVLAAKQIPGEKLPRCLVRAGVDPHTIVLGGSR